MLTPRRATAKRIMLTSRSVVACHGGRFSRGLFSKATSLSAEAEDLTPEKIVAALDKHIVGQSDAKVAVAIALRDQWRRQQLDVDFQRETLPNNILMVGPTGVGKTEVARRLANLAKAPLVNVEATKFTEVGIFGTDTESMIQDLVENAAHQAEERAREAERPAARERAVDKLVEAIGPKTKEARDSLRESLLNGEQQDMTVEVELPPGDKGGGGLGGLGGLGGRGPLGDLLKNMPPAGVISVRMPKDPQLANWEAQLADMLKHGGFKHGAVGRHLGVGEGPTSEDRGEKEKVKVGDALPRLEEAELEKALEGLDVDAMAVALAEQRGIVFVDEIDKLVRRDGTAASASFSKGEGVQKELLALLEGTTVRTRRGPVSTRHILFICAGAFHQSKPADLLPELQGRLPVRVDLKPVRRPPSIPRAPIRHLAFT